MKGQVNFEGAQIGFRNFAGEEGPYNKAGDRNFVVFLDYELAEKMKSDGWNIKMPKDLDRGKEEEEEEDTRRPYLQISVGFDHFPPKIILITGKNINPLTEEELPMLDYVEIKNIDMIVRPYNWTVNGNSGIKAYLKAIYITIESDAFTEKYGM